MKLRLVVLSEGQAKGKAILIAHPQFIIGRDKQCQLRPVSSLISKRHCAVLIRDEKAYIRDLESTNGTVLNDEPVKGEEELKEGDVLQVGPLIFRVEIQHSVAIDQPTPPPGKSLEKLEDDESIAALLMDTEGGVSPARDEEIDPKSAEESTEMDMMMPPDWQQEKKKDEKKEGEEKKKKDEKKGDTSTAAADILSKMYRRR